MRPAAGLMACLLCYACSGSTATSTTSPAPHATAPASTSRPGGNGGLGGPYGLLIVGTNLELVKPDGSVFNGLDCSANHDAVNVQPPVSATSDQVYFRDGGNIRMVTAPSGASDVTTVPNGQSVVSFFSVSPDDQRIAVVVMDVSAAATISVKLYVEDLRGASHHLDIFSAAATRSKTATTLWPVGWHQGYLVLAVVQACTFEPVGLFPSEYHVSSATTAVRVYTIAGTNCELGNEPSPAGVGCANSSGVTTLYDWSSKTLGVTGPGAQFGGLDSGLSPAGQSIFFATTGLAPPATRLVQLGPGPFATVQGHAACAWIDEDHLLAPDAVIQFPAETPGNVAVQTKVTTLPQAGVCAGRFPGGL